MRLVQFDKDSVPSEYPEGFKRTKYHESLGFYVGEYYGDDESIVTYEGELPTDEEPIRIITVGSFKRRFGADVRKLIRESAIDAIIDMREDMDLALYVDLDDLYTVAGVNGLGPNGLGWLDNQGMADMLKDGTDREKYNGVL